MKGLGVLGLLRSCPGGDHAEMTPSPPPPTHVITTDASMTGWGAQMSDMSIHKKNGSYQFLGVENSIAGAMTLVPTPEEQGRVSSNGQYDGCRLPTEGGGHTMQISPLSSSRDLDLGQSSQYIDSPHPAGT